MKITKSPYGDVAPAGHDVLSLLDIEKSFFETFDEGRFQIFKNFLHNLKDGGLFWLTHLSELGCRDSRYAQILGLASVIRSEMFAESATCEVDDFSNPASISNIILVFTSFHTREADEMMDPDNE